MSIFLKEKILRILNSVQTGPEDYPAAVQLKNGTAEITNSAKL